MWIKNKHEKRALYNERQWPKVWLDIVNNMVERQWLVRQIAYIIIYLERIQKFETFLGSAWDKLGSSRFNVTERSLKESRYWRRSNKWPRQSNKKWNENVKKRCTWLQIGKLKKELIFMRSWKVEEKYQIRGPNSTIWISIQTNDVNFLLCSSNLRQ